MGQEAYHNGTQVGLYGARKDVSSGASCESVYVAHLNLYNPYQPSGPTRVEVVKGIVYRDSQRS